MRLNVRFDIDQARLWHVQLLERLAQQPGLEVAVEPVREPPLSHWPDRLLRLEAGLRGHRSLGLADRADPRLFTPYRAEARPAELVLALDSAGSIGTVRTWQVVVDGRRGIDELLPSILTNRSPVVELHEGDTVIAAGRLGTESRHLQIETFADTASRVTSLIVAALSGKGPGLPDARTTPVGATLDWGTAARRAVDMTVRRLKQRVHRALYQTPHWRVGWRKLDGPDLFDLRQHPTTGWHDLADDGRRFYADPFPISLGNTLTLFVEEYPHDTGKGVISAVEFGPEGPKGRPEPVLELPHHLSYPNVFARDGEVWMIPESAGAGQVDLFRATRFPGSWVKEATLIGGVTASDATLCEAGGRWWMFATVADGGAFSDALFLWSAPDFRGPWTPHAQNPVLVDIASARPAGRMVTRDGTLLRPVQDCRRGYGSALGIARVTQIDQTGFAQEVESVIEPCSLWPGECLHTLNQAGGFEFIDGSGMARRRLFG